MSWAEVMTINSNPSIPLNEFIENSYYLYASDNTLTTVNNIGISGSSWRTAKTVTAQYDGALRFTASTLTYNSTCNVRLRIETDDTSRTPIQWDDSGGTSGSPTRHNHTGDFSINKGDIIYIETQGGSGASRLDYAYIQGTIGIGGQALIEQ